MWKLFTLPSPVTWHNTVCTCTIYFKTKSTVKIMSHLYMFHSYLIMCLLIYNMVLNFEPFLVVFCPFCHHSSCLYTFSWYFLKQSSGWNSCTQPWDSQYVVLALNTFLSLHTAHSLSISEVFLILRIWRLPLLSGTWVSPISSQLFCQILPEHEMSQWLRFSLPLLPFIKIKESTVDTSNNLVKP